MKRTTSIAAQCLLAVLITVVSVLGVSSVIELNILERRELRKLQERGELTTARIADGLSYTLWNLNREETERVVVDEIGAADVARILVFDEKGAPYLGRVKGADGTIREIDPANATNARSGLSAPYVFTKDIYHDSKIGSVTLDVTDAHVRSEFTTLRWGIAIKLLLLVIVLSVVLLSALRVLVIRPLSALTAWARRIPGERVPVPLQFKNSGEINALADAFGSMSLNLKNKNEELTNEQARLQELNWQMQLETEDRKRVEEAVKTNEALLRLFIQHTPTAIAMFDKEMRYLQVSDRFLTDYDLEGQNIIGRSHYEVFPNLPERWKEVHRRIIAGAVERCAEDPYVAPDGTPGWLQWESLPWRTGSGEIGGLILFTQVITARKRAEEALQASESRFAVAFNSNPMLATICMLDGGRFLAVNDSFMSLTGYSREEAVGHTALELNLWPDPLDRIRVMDKLQKDTSVRDFEAKIRLKNGEERMLLLSIEKLELDGQPCLLHVANDVTLRKRAEETLRALSARLHSAREEEGTRIAREIHDELGGALTGLKWDLERIDRTLGTATNGSLQPDIHKRIGTMTTLIETTINTVRRISSELRPGVLDDLGLVAAIEWQVEQFQARTGLKCHWNNKVNEVKLSREKATAVFRILQEILTNVLRHARATNLYVKLQRTKDCFELEVKDDGQGITESQRMNARSLGLVGMKERALLVGGEVQICGEEGAGTTVVVRVPLDA